MPALALDKRVLRRQLEAERKAKQRVRVLELRALIRLAVAKRQHERAQIRSQCATARRKLRESCTIRQETARAAGAERIQAAKSELREEQNLERIIRSGDRRIRKAGVRSTVTERRRESDDEVRANLPAELLLAWEKHKNRVRGTQRMSRTEAFLKWAEENPGELFALQNDDAERYVKDLVREHNREARAAGMSAWDDVPF
jgi:hypothetical protein